MKRNKVLNWIVVLLFLIFAIIFIIQLILKLTGHSSTDVQLLYIGVGLILSYLLVMSYKMGIFVGEVNQFMKISKNSFAKVREDIGRLEGRLK